MILINNIKRTKYEIIWKHTSMWHPNFFKTNFPPCKDIINGAEKDVVKNWCTPINCPAKANLWVGETHAGWKYTTASAGSSSSLQHPVVS